MARYTYPGVYVEEIPSGLHTISGVATSVAVFIDFFKEGPMNKAVKIYGMGDFNRIFGGLDIRSDASYAIQQFFLNGGTEAYVIRVAGTDSGAGSAPTKAAVAVCSDVPGTTEIFRATAVNEGIWGNNIRMEVDHNTSDPATLFNLAITRYSSTEGDAAVVLSEKYLELSLDEDDPRYYVDVINEESELVTITRTASAGNYQILPAPTGTVSEDLNSLGTANFVALSAGTFRVQIGSSGWKTATLPTLTATNAADLKAFRKHFEKAIREADTTDASFTQASVQVVEKTVGATTFKYLRITSGKKGKNYDPEETVTFEHSGAGTNVANALGLEHGVSACAENSQEYVLGIAANAGAAVAIAGAVGDDGVEPGATEIIGSQAVDPHTGMYALDYVDIFNIMCIPRAVHRDLESQLDALISNVLDYCSSKRAFFILDIPEGVDTVEEMQEWMDSKANYRDKNAAVYFPRLLQADPLNEYRLKSVGAGGTMAGMYSRIDSTRGVWKAPAGTDAVLRGVSGLDIKSDGITDAQNGTLNPLAINCFRTFPIYGTVCWGGRTLDGSDAKGSEWKYIPVRRLALFLEESLFRGTKWVVFEPNDEPLWAKIRMNIRAFMMTLFRQGAFQGNTPDDAFYVKCDSETTTQTDRNNGIVNIEVGFAPLKPAEFVVLRFRQIISKD